VEIVILIGIRFLFRD